MIRESRLPFTLRLVPHSDAFQLVGETYLHGFMQGEMLDPKWGLRERGASVTLV
jgi:hypothetical protein